MCWSARVRWGGIFDFDSKLKEIEEEEEKTHDPNFWNDAKKAEEILKKIQQKKSWTSSFSELNGLVDDLNTLYEFFKEGEASEEEVQHAFDAAFKKLEDLEFKNMLRGKEDPLNCILEIWMSD